MEKKSNATQTATISAIVLFVVAVLTLPSVIQQIRAFANATTATSLPWLLANLATIGGAVWLGLNLLKQKRDKNVVLGVAVIAAAVLLRLILGFSPDLHRYMRYTYSYYSGSNYEFSFFVFLIYLVETAAYVLLLLFAHFLLNTEDEQKQEQAKKLWFLPAALLIAKLPLGLLAIPISHVSVDIFISGFTGLIRYALAVVFLVEAMQWFAFPEGREITAEYHGDGYKSMIPHLLLCLLTLGIYQLIWICKVTKYLNAKIDSEPAMKPWHQVVASMFVPFYMVYWTYKCSQRLDVVAREQGVQSNLTMLCTILQIFSFYNVILPSILMQDKMNALALLENGELAPNAPAVQNGPTWGGNAAPVAAAPAPVINNPDELPEI